jgi:prepilin-type processing-associated H-X9-DG protein/prepilin-type N-terminal cleavage/methylation domain-containing protein
MRHRLNRVTGFSLVELLTVLAIIALLIAMFAPVIPRARQSALRVQCASNMRQVGAALIMYDQTYKRLPDLEHNRFILISKVIETAEPNPVQAELVLFSGNVYPDELIRMKAATEAVFLCPAHKPEGEWMGMPSFAPNVFYSGVPITKGKGSFILAAEVDGPFGDGSHLAHRDGVTPGELAPRRHGMKSNYLFFDGHVDWLSYAEASGAALMNWGTDQRKPRPEPPYVPVPAVEQ